MSKTRRLTLLAGSAIAVTPALAAHAEDAASQSEAWSSQDEVRATVAEMLADAETRTSLLQSGGTAGHDGDFFLASSDGNFRLNVGGQIQFRYIINFRDNDFVLRDIEPPAGIGPEDSAVLGAQQQNFETGFQTRRTKLIFDGHVFDPALFYKVQGNFSSSTGNFVLEDAYVGYEFDNGFTIRWGQFKLPFLREELVSSARQLTVDRSLTNEVFNQGRSQGIELAYDTENWRAALAFSDGFRSANSEITADRTMAGNPGGLFADPRGTSFLTPGTESQWALTGRFEYLFAGQWNQFRDFTSGPDDDFGLMLGGAVHIEGGAQDHNAFGVSPGGNIFGQGDYFYASWTVDLSVEGQGWNAYFAAIGGHSDISDIPVALPALPNATMETVRLNDYGFVAQGGWRVPNTDWEIFGRYDVLFPDGSGTRRSSNRAFNTLTIGGNWYIHGHAAKFTADIIWFVDSVNQLSGTNTGIAYYQDDDRNEVSFRLQFQLLF